MGLSTTDLTKVFGRRGHHVTALDAVSLHVRPSEMMALLGPSGCGKSTLLRCLGGLEVPTKGVVRLGERTVFDAESPRTAVRAEDRDIGMVFQSYALWPHKTVVDNVAYPLRCRGVRRGEARDRATSTLDLVGCRELTARYPSQLSGGQQQRVALARALVAEPSVILFDEPLSNLDARLRETLRLEIRDLHQRLGFTGVYVTHDQDEASVVADRIAVMEAGRIIQRGQPQDLHREPATDFVARFVGDMNTFPGHLTSVDESGVGLVTGLDGREMRGQLQQANGASDVSICVAPTELRIAADEKALHCNVWQGVVMGIAERGPQVEVVLRIADGQSLKLSVLPEDTPNRGTSLTVEADVGSCLVLPREGPQFPSAQLPPGIPEN